MFPESRKVKVKVCDIENLTKTMVYPGRTVDCLYCNVSHLVFSIYKQKLRSFKNRLIMLIGVCN